MVEDERDLNRIICKRLAAAGYSTDACYDGREALDYLEAAVYDAAVFDVMMPRMDGFEAVRRLRERGCTRSIKVAVMGCVVNGPGEAKGADIGIAGGKDCAMLFVKGQQKRMLRGDIVGELIREIEQME